MNVISRVLFLVFLVVLLAESFSFGGQIQMEFKKGLWPNTYYFIVNNTDSDRAIEFRGGWEDPGAETNYYVLVSNKGRHYFSSPIFEEIGIKGRLWIYAGEKTRIPFKLPKDVIKSARSIVFNGFSFIPAKVDGTTDQKDIRALTIIYDIHKKKFETVISDKPIKTENSTIFFKKEDSDQVMDGKRRLSVDQLIPSDSFGAIDADKFGAFEQKRNDNENNGF